MALDLTTLTLFLVAAAILAMLLTSIYSIGPTEVGLVRKRFGAKLPGNIPGCRCPRARLAS